MTSKVDPDLSPTACQRCPWPGHLRGAQRPLSSGSSRRDEILAVAARQFAESGYVSTSLREIAEAAHILPGSLYHHFESKEAIAVEPIEAMQPALGAITSQSLASTDTPLAVLRSFGRDVAAFSRPIWPPYGSVSSTLPRAPPLASPNSSGSSLPDWSGPGHPGGRADAAGGRHHAAPDVELGLLALTLHHSLLAVTTHVPSEQVADTLTSVALDGIWQRAPDLESEGAARVGEALDGIKDRWLARPDPRW